MYSNIIWFSAVLHLVDARKISTLNPISEILFIFFTLVGLALLFLAAFLYLQQQGHTNRIRNWLSRWNRAE
jgi:hypothetical protein